MFFVLYITKSSARTGIAAGRDEIFFFLMGRLCNRSLQFRQQRRSAPQLSGESFNCAQGGGVMGMLLPFSIILIIGIVKPNRPSKRIKKLIQRVIFLGQVVTACSQTSLGLLCVFH